VQKALESLPWAKNVEVDGEAKKASLLADPERYDEKAIVRVLDKAGYAGSKVIKWRLSQGRSIMQKGVQHMNELFQPRDHRWRLLFCCIENQCRSQMAQGFARLYGGDQVEAYSAGTRPSGRIHPKAVAAMRERGYDLEPHHSKALTDVPDIDFDALVTFGCADACAGVRARRREDWAMPVPKDLPPEEFRSVRDQIEAKVKDLLAEIKVLPVALA
jgi:protein-tyrosine-phosphatase